MLQETHIMIISEKHISGENSNFENCTWKVRTKKQTEKPNSIKLMRGYLRLQPFQFSWKIDWPEKENKIQLIIDKS